MAQDNLGLEPSRCPLPLPPQAARLHSGPQLSIWAMGLKLDNEGSLRDGPRGSASPAGPQKDQVGPGSAPPARLEMESRGDQTAGVGVGGERENTAAFLVRVLSFFKITAVERATPPSVLRLPRGPPGSRPCPPALPGLGRAGSRSFGFTLVPPVSLSGRRRKEKAEQGMESAQEAPPATGSAACPPPRPPHSHPRGLPPDLTPGPGILISLRVKVKGSRSSSLVIVGGASHLLRLGSFPQTHPLESGAESHSTSQHQGQSHHVPSGERVGQGAKQNRMSGQLTSPGKRPFGPETTRKEAPCGPSLGLDMCVCCGGGGRGQCP
uniref:Uncharacterized protein LOC112815469 n=1 Tax=Callorhinus ursinus TaxID=34884 RepID=A0A3Q7NB61_CALUR|nr:uncharacterized protein LOC112815469 [Callorhinus ursinus]XP_025717282.1 uncharacterized protein LOC112815469 [Callorhinus ursinus]XP_025717283.1 uncharacterized protein LOC112815469 [Callorhinus ursinus]XP_025717284.1 uncharacterized protein LOC112815469 [Callorhinus ursinus]XP_025717285.1 uncharacterized protein LOC112815469 [Callorhinus ursinus]